MRLVIIACGCFCLALADISGYYKRKAEKFMAEKAKQKNVTTLKSGVLVEVIKSGINQNARSPHLRSKVKATYSCALSDGTIYDGDTFIFSPGELPLKAWGETMTFMGESDKWRMYIPPALGYGDKGISPKPNIPPFSVLVIDTEIHIVLGDGYPIKEAKERFISNSVDKQLYEL